MFKVTKTNPEVFHNEKFGTFYRGFVQRLDETEEEADARFEQLKKKCNKKFRVCDDDGEWYFKGYSTSNNDARAFDPLDCLGIDYGCTYIEYWNETKKIWEEL